MNKNKQFKYGMTALVWLALLAILTWVFSSRMSPAGPIPGHSHFYMALTALVFKTLFIGAMIFTILPQFSRKRRLSIFILQSAVSLFVCFTSEQFIQAYIAKPYFSLHEHGLLKSNPFWMFNLFAFLFLLLVICSYYFTKEWIRHEKQKRELIESQFTTELKYLKNQVNPHFLFNTLNNLFSIAQRNNDNETAGGISKLAGLMRYMLYDSSVTRISLEKELRNMEDYISLSKLRYPADEIVVDLSKTGEMENSFIAPMILLPFVENAFKHGVDIEKTTKIVIHIVTTANKIIFTCSNPVAINSKMQPDEYSGIGLENVKRRLQLLYPQKHDLKIHDTGNEFNVKLELES